MKKTEKFCKHCQQMKPRNAFRERQERGLESRCKSCRNRQATLRVHGLSPAEYADMVKAQAGRCAICERLPEEAHKTGRLFVDHEHETGTVRGLLCHDCNIMLGAANDRHDALLKGAAFLERFEFGF